MKTVLKRASFSFVISALVGLFINLLIDVIFNQAGKEGFISMSPAFIELFDTPVMAAYVNVILYGVIGAQFAAMTVIFDSRRIGVIVQWILYFCVTSAICIVITIFLWQLHKYPMALVCTFLGYGLTYLIMGIVQYRKLKEDIKVINESVIAEDTAAQSF